MSLDYMFVDAVSVRDYLTLNPDAGTGNTRYTDATIGSNIRAAGTFLEKACRRLFADRPAATLQFTTQGRAQLFIPGIRNLSTVQVLYQGSNMNVAVPPSNVGAVWFLPDAQQSGLYTGVQIRAFRSGDAPGPGYLSNPQWFDRALDSPFFPGNYSGGYGYSSLPNDLAITGDWGMDPAERPETLLHATKVMAAFYTMRPASLLADVAITPGGTVVNYAQLPSEVRQFISEWQAGEQAVSAG